MTKVLTEAQQVADFLIEEMEKGGEEKIDLIILYGGVAQGREHEHSDIDMCLLTSGETKYSWCFIWKERVVDAHSMTWEELEQLTKGNNWSWCVGCSKITHSKILWAKSEEYVRKLEELAQKIPKGGEKLVQKATNEFNCVQGLLWQMQEVCEKEDTLSLAPLAWHIANQIVAILAAVNNQPLLNNWGKQLKEIAALKEKPDNLIPRYEELVTTQEPKRALELAKELVEEVQDLLKNWREEQGRNEIDPVEKVLDNWSDIMEYYNKIASAKQKNNLVAGRFAATNYSEYALWAFATLREFAKKGKTKQEILERLPEEHQKQIKKLLQTNDLKELLTAATKVKELMEKELQQKNLELPIATTLEEARKLIKKRNR